MNELTLKQIIDAVNHNAGLLEKHLNDGVYVHRQNEASCVWQVNHSLGSLRPLIETYDSSGNRVGHSVNRDSQTFDFTEITFAVPMSGTAILRF
ncbi:hypothetical protein FACS1894214_1520 [Planctomycetales bacterium]|nr:hypothetical protein FACS1894214_1520 [Planctomycetales bacterium]